MKKVKILSIILGLLFTFIIPTTVGAEGIFVSESSASFLTNYSNSSDLRVSTLKAFLEKHKSPLAPYSDDFIYYADLYDIDWRLVPAISGVESTFGKKIPANSYNAYGWAGGKYRFNSWEHSIEVVTKALREKYYDRGANTLSKINRIYCPPNPKWAGKVVFFMNKIEATPLYFDI